MLHVHKDDRLKNKLEEMCQQTNITQQQLADMVHVSSRTISV